MTAETQYTGFSNALRLSACLALLMGLSACDIAYFSLEHTAPKRTGSATTTALPLKHGYYVATDTSCHHASNATTILLRHNGLSGARYDCEFQHIEAIDAEHYRITESCSYFQDTSAPATMVVTYTLQGDSAFSATNTDGWTHSARYCPQSSMPPAWQENDINEMMK